MLFALIVAALVAAIAVSVSFFIQAIFQKRALERQAQQRTIAEFARRTGGVVTPRMIARELKVTPHDADRLLRSMVDDVYLSMDVDIREGELRFVFPELTKELESDSRARRRSSLKSSSTSSR